MELGKQHLVTHNLSLSVLELILPNLRAGKNWYEGCNHWEMYCTYFILNKTYQNTAWVEWNTPTTVGFFLINMTESLYIDVSEWVSGWTSGWLCLLATGRVGLFNRGRNNKIMWFSHVCVDFSATDQFWTAFCLPFPRYFGFVIPISVRSVWRKMEISQFSRAHTNRFAPLEVARTSGDNHLYSVSVVSNWSQSADLLYP